MRHMIDHADDDAEEESSGKRKNPGKKKAKGKKKWIQAAIKRPGQLHRDLGVPEGEKIPKEAIEEAARKPGKIGQRARLAKALARIRKG